MFFYILWTLFFTCLVIFLSKMSVCVKGVGLFPGWLPFVGHGLLLIHTKDIFSFMRDLGTKSIENGGIIAFLLGWKPVYIITNAEEATTVLTKCLEKMFIYKFIEPLFGNTLVSAEGTTWKRHRRFLDQAFKQQILEGYLKVFNEQASSLVDTLAHKVGGYVDITDDITRNVLEATCQTTMGINPIGENFANDQFIKALHRVFEIVTLRVQNGLFFDVIFNHTNLKKELDASLKIIHEISMKMVQIQKLEHLEKLKSVEQSNQQSENETHSFLQIMIANSVTQHDSIFTDHQLRCLCDNVLLAAFYTSTYELIFTLVCIGSDEDVQNKIYNELTEVLGKDTEVTQEHISKLVYLEAATKEALRLYPIGPVVARDATTDIQLGKVTLPAGSSIAVHLWAINRNKEYWGSGAEEYNPGRWMNADTLPRHPNAFGSFSFGRRNCIGKNYALLYMKTTLAHILKNYRVTSDHRKMEFDCYIMLKVKSGHLMKLEPR